MPGYGSKDAILDTLFLNEYEKKLSPAPDPKSSGLQQALAHFDRIRSSTPRTAICCGRYSC